MRGKNAQRCANLLPVGKGLVNGGVAHASDSDRATGVGRGDRVRSVITETAAGASRGISSDHPSVGLVDDFFLFFFLIYRHFMA